MDWGSIGRFAGDYLKSRYQNSATGRFIQDFRHASDDTGAPPDMGQVDRSPAFSQDQQYPGIDEGGILPQYGGGKIVTHPTTAILGEKGPEAVIPLTNQPGARTSTAMLGGLRTRYRAR